MVEGPYDAFHGAQTSPHRDLERVVGRHLDHAYRRPVAEHNRRAFERIRVWKDEGARLIIDAGCGTAESTSRIAANNATALVIGIDRSLVRLRRNAVWKDDAIDEASARRGNCALLRADVEDIWSQMVDAQLRATKLYLLYPNPYPKASQLKRRWHAHPSFPALLRSCDEIELRCSWRVYAEEFARACELVAGQRPTLSSWRAEEPLSAFERKYWASATETFRLLLELPSD